MHHPLCLLDFYVYVNDVVPVQEKQTKEALTRKQQKGKKKGLCEEESQEAPELLKRPREYTVKFTFPDPPPLSPPILGLHCKTCCSLLTASPRSSSVLTDLSLLLAGVDFGYDSQKLLFKNVDFGIDMESRSEFCCT